MARRSCANCGQQEWIDYRWCRDCWRAAAKSASATIGAAVTSWLLTRAFFLMRLYLG